MNILFMHPNAPGQYLYLAQFFANNSNNRVAFVCQNLSVELPKIIYARYEMYKQPEDNTHPFLQPMEEAVLHGISAYRAVLALKEQHNFIPDIIIAHSGWGDALYMKDLYPDVPLICYCEWFYKSHGSDVGYFSDEIVLPEAEWRIRTKNAHHLLCLNSCDAGHSPTEWQKSQFPKEYQSKISVMHEGVDVNNFCPKDDAKLILDNEKLNLSEVPEIITYISRGFEEYRGFPQFMEALALVLEDRPKCHAVIVGGNKVFYGGELENGKTFKDEMLDRLKNRLDMNRVHFTGYLYGSDYLKVLQASTIHVYLTRPFVLSWSMIEAMSSGCCLISSKTPPVEEVMVDGENGLLANFRSAEHIAMRMTEALNDDELRKKLSYNARKTILDNYSLRKALTKQANFIYSYLK